MEWEIDRKQDLSDEKNTKRRMKTPSQLEILERVYAEDKYPSEAVRAELSAQLELTDKQLQMWFGHKRLKDRKVKEEEPPAVSRKLKKEMSPAPKEYPAAVLASEVGNAGLIARGYYDDYGHGFDPYERDIKAHFSRRRDGRDFLALPRRRSQQTALRVDPRIAAELAAITAVEAQLGEPLREDGPVLGVEFEPLPPGAFDTSIEPVRQVEPVRPRKVMAAHDGLRRDTKARERHDIKQLKSVNPEFTAFQASGVKRKAVLQGAPISASQRGARAPHEYQFIPEQPLGTRFYERNLFSNTERPLEILPQPKVTSLAPPGSFLHGSDLFPTGKGYGFESRASTGGFSFLPPSDSRNSGLYASNDFSHEHISRRDALTAFPLEGQYATVPVVASERPFSGSEKLALFHEQERARMEKKRKIEEARLAKEIEAQEKRIRKEIEKQDALRRKREEQMRKEIEKQDREKKKEETRLNREKLREEERVQRELRRELERREKILQKEYQRAENQRRKEEVRIEKEAARMKAAFERATAKKLAKESKGAMDDEELELMQAHAIIAKGLSSTQPIDDSSVQSFDPYEVITKQFPPPSVKMKKPFSVSPWIDSEENVSKFFMVWRFLTTFADVLGLWPFTVDELAQSFHDYDSRLLNEIHVALLKTLVKDVDDAAHAAANGTAASIHATAIAACGHPKIVEAAYAWGFDIQEWGWLSHSLTWPEVIRQFALAAGFGPKWKKRKVEIIRHKDPIEVNEGEDVVATLRSGAAAANAVALMQGKRIGHMRRSRYRLTPGTVKYAAFHVLSLEGDKGLSILEVADKIQKSGLRDLTTSKTPEASISAALSRDANLFERVAPSTYALRPAFRKDPQYAEEILQAAKEKIRAYQTDLLDAEEADKDAEDIDVDDDFEVDEQDIEGNEPENVENNTSKGKMAFRLKEGRISQVMKDTLELDEDVEIDESQVGEPWVQGLVEGEYANLSVEERLNVLVALVDAINEGNTIRVALEERYELASALKRQLWEEVQLDKRRVKEELISKSQPTDNAGAKSEGAIDVASDERRSPFTSAADGLRSPVHEKKVGEDSILTFNTMKKEIVEANKAAPQVETTDLSVKDFDVPDGVPPVQEKLSPNIESALFERSRAQIKAEIRLRAEKLYVFRSLPLGYDRRRNRYWHFVTCNGGQDPGSGRIYFESQDGHWEVIDSEEVFDSLMSSLDTRGIREFHLHTVLKKLEGTLRQGMRSSGFVMQPIGNKSSLSGLGFNMEGAATPSILNERGKCLLDSRLTSVNKTDDSPSSGISGLGNEFLDSPGAIKVELSTTAGEKLRALDRYKDMERWLWIQCFRSDSSLRAVSSGQRREAGLLNSCDTCQELYWPKERHCPCCHITVDIYKREKKFQQHVRECEDQMRRRDSGWKMHGPTKVLPPRIQLLKRILLSIEAAIPHEAFKGFWSEARKSWSGKLKGACAPRELLEVFLELESAVEQEWLSSSYETAEEILKSLSTGDETDSCSTSERSLFLPWIPHTTAAVALRVMAFDAALAYSTEQKQQLEDLVKDHEDNEKDLQISPVVSSVPDVNEDAESDQLIIEDDKEAPVESHVRVRGRGRGRGRCRVNSRGGKPTGNGGKRGASKRKLQFNETVDQQNNSQVAKPGRGRGPGRPRGRPARGRGRGGRISGRKQVHTELIELKGKRSTAESNIKKQPFSDQDESAEEAFDDWDAQDQSGASEPSGDDLRDHKKDKQEEDYGDDTDEQENGDEGEDEDDEDHEEDDAREIDIEVSDEQAADDEDEEIDDEDAEEEDQDDEVEEREVDEDEELQSSSS